ncbi:MAG: CDP-diacylglycerol--serine O-phosphatidyltransferase [Myxococcota bacterium]
MSASELPSRRRRRRRSERRGIAWLLPHVLTTGNLAAGFYAIVASSTGELDRAAFAVVLAGVFDGLDGRVARRVGATSRFGGEYDSIADTVSFGVAPAVIAFRAGALGELGSTGWVLAFVYMACAALRLARFNVSPGRYSGRFEGLPSPAAAGMVVATVLFAGFLSESGMPLALPAVMPGLGVAFLGLLMVSSIPYRSFKGLSFRGSYRALVLMVIGFAVLLLKPSVTLFAVGVAYVSSGPLGLFWRWRSGLALEPIVAPDELPGEGDPESLP